jgi:hypothetical protein
MGAGSIDKLWLAQLTFRTTRGVLYVGGRLQRITASNNEMYQAALREMDLRLRAIRDVRDVKYRLANWQRNVDGGWSPGSGEAQVTIDVEAPPSAG